MSTHMRIREHKTETIPFLYVDVTPLEYPLNMDHVCIEHDYHGSHVDPDLTKALHEHCRRRPEMGLRAVFINFDKSTCSFYHYVFSYGECVAVAALVRHGWYRRCAAALVCQGLVFAERLGKQAEPVVRKGKFSLIEIITFPNGHRWSVFMSEDAMTEETAQLRQVEDYAVLGVRDGDFVSLDDSDATADRFRSLYADALKQGALQ